MIIPTKSEVRVSDINKKDTNREERERINERNKE
jgi:hypothetical protein